MSKMVLLMSVLLSLSVYSFIVLWVLLELNFLAFIALLNKSTSFKCSNKTLNYFLIQAVGSGLILIMVFMVLMRGSYSFLGGVYFLALLLKLGGVPFHNWYLSLVQKLSWEMIWVLSIWQKLIPLLMMSKPGFKLLMLAGVLSVSVSSVLSISQKNVKKILGLSSVFSLGWVLVSFDFSQLIWVQFMGGYGASLLIFLGGVSLANQGEVQNFNKLSSSLNLIVFFSAFLMISGIPPFIGFFLKMLVLLNLIHSSVLLSLIFLIFSLLFIFVYMNIVFLLFTFVIKKFSFNSLVLQGGYYFLDLVVLNLVLSILFLANFCNLLHK